MRAGKETTPSWTDIRTQLGWPFGSHWCWFDTVQWSIAAFAFLLNGTVIMGFGRPRLLALPLGFIISMAGWACVRAVRRHWRQG